MSDQVIQGIFPLPVGERIVLNIVVEGCVHVQPLIVLRSATLAEYLACAAECGYQMKPDVPKGPYFYAVAVD